MNLFSQMAVPPAGDGTEDNPYQIGSLENLYWMSQNEEEWDKYYSQIAVINASETANWFDSTGWQPIGYWNSEDDNAPFTGVYDGQSNTIDGLYINRETSCVGLFGYTDGAELVNIKMTNVDIQAIFFVGGLVGESYNSNISNCHGSGIVKGNWNTGLLIGKSENSTIHNCDSAGAVIGISGTGGLIGSINDSHLTESFSTAEVEGSFLATGGLVGINWNFTISDCYSSGDVNGDRYVGGLVGWNTAHVHNSYSLGDVTGNNKVGGLIGHNNGTIDNNFSSGNIEGVNYVGGLIGWHRGELVISNSHSKSDVSGNYSVGGFVGYNDYRSLIDKCYSVGNVYGVMAVGGFVGINRISTIQKSFSLGNVSGESWLGGFVGDSFGDHYNDTKIMNSYSRGDILRAEGSDFENLGGFAGSNSSTNAAIKHCYSTGSVTYENTQDPDDKGFSGYGTFSVYVANFFDKESSQQNSGIGAQPKTTEEMQIESTFIDAGWDFAEIWAIDGSINDGYPHLLHSVVSGEEVDIPNASITMVKNYPNPFNPETNIEFNINQPGKVKIEVFNIRGQLIDTILDEYKPAGKHTIIWDGKNQYDQPMGSGVYMYRIISISEEIVRKMVLIK
jgi:hypothetical protein